MVSLLSRNNARVRRGEVHTCICDLLVLWLSHGHHSLQAPLRDGTEPDSGEIPWHQDAPYWNIYPERHGVLWVALEVMEGAPVMAIS